MIKKYLLIMCIAFIVAAGVYYFSGTDKDIHQVQTDGQVVHVTPVGTHSNNNVMLTLFSLQTKQYWQIQLPDSTAKAPLTELKESNGIHLATGRYQDGDEYGVVSVEYDKITPLNLGKKSGEMVFTAPFAVSNQGSGIFWYLGLFQLNTSTAVIKQIDTIFLGDRIIIKGLQPDEPFDVTSSVQVTFYHYGPKQSMAETPSELVEQHIKVSMAGFAK